PLLGPQVAFCRLAAFGMDGQGMACLVVIGAQCGQPLVAHQHQEALLGEIGRSRGVEAGGPILDGVEPVGRQGLAGFQDSPGQSLRRQAFYGVSVDGLDAGGGHKVLTLTLFEQAGSSNYDNGPNITLWQVASGGLLSSGAIMGRGS